jgi:hypothetical protein
VVEGLVMANRRSIARRIAPQVGLEPRIVEKVLGTYFAALAAASNEGVGAGSLGRIKRRFRRVRIIRPGEVAADELRAHPKFVPSQGLRRAAADGTLPPGVRRLLG